MKKNKPMFKKLLSLFALFIAINGWGQRYTDVAANVSTNWNTTRWSTSSTGPFNTAWVSGSAATFDAGSYLFNAMGTNAANTVGNVTVSNNSKVGFVASANSFNATSPMTFDIASGCLFDFGTQSCGATARITKTGAGTLSIYGGNSYTGGITLDAGTLMLTRSSSLGANNNTVQLNGGIFASTLSLTGQIYNVIVNGNVQFGDISYTNYGGTTTNISTFGANFTGGSVTLTGTPILTLGNSGSYSFAAAFTNVTATGVTFAANSNGSAGTFTLSGANTYTGLTTVSGGTLRLNTTGGTTIPTTNSVNVTGGTLRISQNQQLVDLTISAGGSLLVDAGVSLTITGTLSNAGSITNNGIITAPSGALILKSNINGSGYIANSSGTFTNPVTIERYIPDNRRTSRFLGHPFSNALDMSSLIDDIYITGAGGASNGFDATTTNNPSSFWFDNSLQNWIAFTTTSDASWTQYRGIRVLVRGDRSQPTALTGGNPSPNAVTLDMTGTINTGAQTITVPLGYSVLGNPYPAPVNLGSKLDALTAGVIGTQYWIWDANAGPTTGAYVTRTIGSGAYNLAMNGAFVVSPVSPTSIPFVEADKQAVATANLFRTNTLSGQLELQVLYNNYTADNMFVRFNTASSDNKDALDGEKLLNPEVNFYALSADNKKLSLDTRTFAENKIIPLGFTATAANSFKIKVADYGITEETYLIDKYLNTTTQLLAGTEYNFSVDPSLPASDGENRFELMMKGNSILPATFLNVKAAQKNSSIEVCWTTANETNMSNYLVEESIDGINFTQATNLEAKNATANSYSWLDGSVFIGDNYYRIKAVEKNGIAKYSNVVKVKIGGKRSEFTVYPNPVKGGVVSLQMNNVEKGIYNVKIYNNIGQELAAKTINHAGGSATQTIDLGKGIASGSYNMQIINGTTIITKTIIVE
jgi:autotransporter-associated beta strand protein